MERILIRETVQRTGERIRVAGWVATRRDHGKLIFIDLRDASGVLQAVFRPDDAGLYAQAEKLRPEWVIVIEGVVRARPTGMENPNLATGSVELAAEALEILNESKTPPFPLGASGLDIEEELRLKYRYLDLRRDRLQKNLRLRSDVIETARRYLFDRGFTEIETPLLTKSTPEGARDFLVPSRLQPGSFYALPQSPQQYKQLLMVAGFERYFQIARCVRDEDLRADRGFEHTQIDIEMAFVGRKEVMALDEGMITAVVEGMGRQIKGKPFPVFTYAEAAARFGADKFDLRNDKEKQEGVLAFAWVTDFPFFEKDRYGRWTFTHNPFSHPKPEHTEWLMKGERIGEILTTQYDLVCNGLEVGGGSMRSHKPEMLRAVFRVMDYDDARIERQFGHMLEALEYGAPPHGGIAHGVERLVMVLTGEDALREVQAFPMTSGGRTAVMDAPSPADPEQLAELGIEVRPPNGR